MIVVAQSTQMVFHLFVLFHKCRQQLIPKLVDNFERVNLRHALLYDSLLLCYL